MKLLYLYIEDYGCIKNQEFNFDSQYHFYLDKSNPQKWELIEEKVENPLADDFWSSSTGKHNVIESVSAIIGENGSGKTTLARFIGQIVGEEGEKELKVGDLFSPEIKLQEKECKKYISVFYVDDKEKVKIFSNMKILYKGIEHLPISYEKSYSLYLQLPKLVYYSPYYTTEHLIDPTLIIDLSTSRCLAQGSGTRTEKFQNLINSLLISPTHAHEHYEYMNCLRFIYANNGRKIIEDLHFPEEVIICPENELINIVKNELKKMTGSDSIAYNRNKQTIQQIQSCCNSVIHLLTTIHTSDCFVVSFVYYIACYCKDHLFGITSVAQANEGEPLKNELNKINKYIAFAQNLCNNLPAFQTIDILKESHQSILKYLNSNKRNKHLFFDEYSFFFKLEELYDRSSKDKKEPLLGLHCPCDLASDIIELYYKCFAITNFLSVTFNPKLSSGEMSFFTMFSRLYDSLINELNEQQDIILFLDEAETTLHPEWQRCLVSCIIDFLEGFANDHRVQVIFASHSPILLSDIPDSNVIFLKRDENTRGAITVDHKEIGKTFGSNIYTLYKKSFFLDNGLMGKFAEQKIEDIIKDLLALELNLYSGNRENKYQELGKVIDLIGEPVIRNQLKDRLNWVQMRNKWDKKEEK